MHKVLVVSHDTPPNDLNSNASRGSFALRNDDGSPEIRFALIASTTGHHSFVTMRPTEEVPQIMLLARLLPLSKAPMSDFDR
jgi:hypothetical protein